MSKEVLVCCGCERRYADPTIEEIISSPCCGKSIVEEYTEERLRMLTEEDEERGGDA